ncbi:hypothetical protein [uncultured archaeal virus]|uniref:Uncharacterized protein n=1 Tax=uncultured archaeal virus TaxID=1960247 RepID=A0A8B0LP53_9VIRU|nr:hypothetical protein [uncultured archaeal virus]
MTILYKTFSIVLTADNQKHNATSVLTCPKGKKIHFSFLGIAPYITENCHIQVFKDQEQLTGEGIYHAIIDDYTHRLDFDVDLNEGEAITIKGWSMTAYTVEGVYAYEELI